MEAKIQARAKEIYEASKEIEYPFGGNSPEAEVARKVYQNGGQSSQNPGQMSGMTDDEVRRSAAVWMAEEEAEGEN